MKYNTFRIEPQPIEKYPDMVAVQKGKLYKRFVDESKAKAWIDAYRSQQAINKEARKAKKQLRKTVVLND